ncbi:MAG: Hsp20/alpha crystallin family protein, partial [Saprospiraceae bacterium]
MNIVKVNPFLQGKTFSHLVDDMFNRSISDLVGTDYAITQPSVNIAENDDNYILEVAAPGLDKKDFNVQVEKDQLIISVSKEETSTDQEDGKWTRKEFNFRSFKRSFHLSDTVDAEKIQASYHNGILQLVIPKKEEAKVSA